MSRRVLSLEQIFDAHLRVLATTLRPNSVAAYRKVIRRFLRYLHAAFPKVQTLSQLHRDPHLLAWFRSLCDQDRPLCNQSRLDYLVRLRRLFGDLVDNGHRLQPDLIRREDFPPQTRYLPKPLSPEEDQHLEQQLRHADDLESNALLLIRFTGMRIGECIDLPVDCLRQVRHDQWALHVPVGKLHTERWVPVDEDTRRILDRILALRASFRAPWPEKPLGFLLPRRCRQQRLYQILHHDLADAARRAGCTTSVTPHRLRHTFATTMLRLGVSLPALMQLLGHKNINMTLRYVDVTQQDLQREFHRARQSTASLHLLPKLPLPQTTTPPQRVDLSTIRDAITAVRHLLQLFRLELQDPNARSKLRRLSQRLLNLSHALNHLILK
jgi:site-specific recombinase XerD